MQILNLTNVKKAYNKKVVLDIDHISLEKGKIYGYLGKNGAGKSTTMNIIMGIEQADQGEICFDDRIVGISDLEYKRFIGYCPDYPAIFSKLTVYEHLSFVAALYGVEPKNKVNDMINYYLEYFNLKQYEDMLLETLSRGNQQKVSIVSSLIHNPKLLVYDEPTMGLDPISLKQFKNVLKKFSENGGTVFLSSHSLNVIEEIADYVIVIENGKIIRNSIQVDNIRESLGSIEEYLLKALNEDENYE